MKIFINKTNGFFHSLASGATLGLLNIFAAHAAPTTLINESFEGVPVVAWQHTWGSTANSSERAHGGKQSLRCAVEDKYGMSVHFYDLPVKAGATYTLTAAIFIPQQEKECFPQLQICDTTKNWGVRAKAIPAKKGEWEELRCQWTNTEGLQTIRVALHDSPWKAGLGGAVYFWDDIVLTEDGGEAVKAVAAEEHPAMPENMDAKAAGGGGKIAPVVAPASGAARTLVRESFEGSPAVPWVHNWGTFANSSERAHSGKQSLQCTVENKYGMSVHFYDLPAKPSATYTLTAAIFIPQQEKECFPQLQICNTNWGAMVVAVPAKKGEWEELRCQWVNRENLKTIRIAMHNSPWKEGLGGATYFWDDVVLTEEGGVAAKPELAMAARGKNPAVLAGLEIKPAGGMKITVSAGKARVLDREVAVAETTLVISPSPTLQITDEATTLTDEVPKEFAKGTALKQCFGFAATLPCLESGSVVIKEKSGSDGIIYEKGKDWRADEIWGRVGRIPGGRIAAGQTVYIDYRTRPLRVDTICISPSGKVSVNQGDSQKICPSIPNADYGNLALAHIFLDYGCKEITAKEIYPVGEAYQPDVSVINSYRARVPNTREKLEQGKDVTIVAWGDSVTAGGDATRPELRFGEAFAQALRYKYPQAHIKLINAGRGGWNTARSLPLFEDDVLKYKPDLVTMEFVNDMGMGEANLRKNWFEAIDRVRAIGGEAIIVTPHFVLPMWMKFSDNATPETRVAVEYLRRIAEDKQVAVADASKRWEHLALEGVPYLVHLRNGINHPDDFGHNLFVEELMRLF